MRHSCHIQIAKQEILVKTAIGLIILLLNLSPELLAQRIHAAEVFRQCSKSSVEIALRLQNYAFPWGISASQ